MSQEEGVAFRRRTKPLGDGRVLVTIEVRLAGRLAGRIVQTRGGWQFRPVGAGRRGWEVGQVWPTAEECKRSLGNENDGNEESGTAKEAIR